MTAAPGNDIVAPIAVPAPRVSADPTNRRRDVFDSTACM
jgi:hypothetical protein